MDFLAITDAEQESILRLKAELDSDESTAGFLITDTTILRFLRGKKQVEKKALAALKSYVEWHKTNDVDGIPFKLDQCQKEVDKKLLTFGTKDKKNRPICYHYPHRHKSGDRIVENMTMYMIYSLSSVMKLTKPQEERMVVVSYMGQFTLQCMDYECTKVFISILQENYPETLHLALVVDAPSIFSVCWAIIKPWLDPVTQSKVKFIKKEELVEYIDADVIPDDLK